MIYNILQGAIIALALLSFASLYVAYKGPTAADRVVAINIISIKVTIIITALSLLTDQHAFVDVALIYAMIGFVATVCVSKFIERGRLL